VRSLRLKPVVARLDRWYRKATTAERLEGAVWYARAREQCADLANQYGHSLATVAGIVAALSPRVRWERSLVEAKMVLFRKDAPKKALYAGHAAFKANVLKAHLILHGWAPDRVLRGLKVVSFYRTLLGVPAEPVLDTIAVLAATLPLTPFTAGEDAKRYLNRPRDMRTIATAYNALALELSVPVHVVQAVIWITYRNERDAL